LHPQEGQESRLHPISSTFDYENILPITFFFSPPLPLAHRLIMLYTKNPFGRDQPLNPFVIHTPLVNLHRHATFINLLPWVSRMYFFFISFLNFATSPLRHAKTKNKKNRTTSWKRKISSFGHPPDRTSKNFTRRTHALGRLWMNSGCTTSYLIAIMMTIGIDFQLFSMGMGFGM